MNYCSECGSKLSDGAKFCHRCGRPLGGSASSGLAGRTWLVGGAALIVIASAAIVAIQSAGSSPPLTPPAAPAPVDPLSLPPQEQADRLFDRVMRLTEGGDSSQAAFFIPMAIQAHQMLPSLTADARFHIGELELLRGGIAAARAQADSVRQLVTSHLFATMLLGKAAEQAGDAEAAAAAYREFLANQEAELAVARPEYDQHQFALNQFAGRARAGMRGQ